MRDIFTQGTTILGTATAGTLSVNSGSVVSGQQTLVSQATAYNRSVAFAWAFKDNGTVIQQGVGLAGADAGCKFDPPYAVAPAGSAGMFMTPLSGTSTGGANLLYRVISGNR